MAAMSDMRTQAVTGVVPPEIGEALIREVWPSVTYFSAPAALGKKLMQSIFLAPLGWFMLLPLYFTKVMPFIGRRYRLTNRRLMFCRGLSAVPSQEVPLSKIDDVRLVEGSYDSFYRAGTLEILSGGQVVMSLPACSFADSFRENILSARQAWAPKKA